MMRRNIVLVAGLLVSIVVPSLAIASSYKAANFGGSTYMTWRFAARSPDRTAAPESNYVQVGHACVTKDTLEGMARTAFIYRYSIMKNTGAAGDLKLLPLNGVLVRPGVQGYAVETTAPASGETWLDNAQMDAATAWVQADLEPDDLGIACVDGGIASGLKVLEQRHGMIQR
jgi:hypothetical protein